MQLENITKINDMRNINKVILLASILLFYSVLSYAQQVKISFLDGKSNQPIEYVKVIIADPQNPNKTTIKLTDKNGDIYLNKGIGSKVVLNATFIGYKPFKESLTLKSEQEFNLQEDVLNLEQVTVTGTRTPHILKQSPVLTQLISAEEIKEVDAQTLPDILEIEMPGMEMSSHGGVPVMNMMGLETQYSLVLIDGERLAISTLRL